MFRHTFTVDVNLRLLRIDDSLRKIRGLAADTVVGKLYFHVLPSIHIEGKDAVGYAISEGKEIRCDGYRSSCIFDDVDADIVITPTQRKDGVVTGAEVAISADVPCSSAKSFTLADPLVDIAKLSASLAHGVRNPLNAIKGAVTYLSDKYGDDPTLTEFTGIIHQEVERLSAFITRFLSNNSNLPVEATPVQINEIVKRMCAVTELQARTKRISLRYSLDDIPLVIGDSFHLEHALLNLVNNAVEAMPDGGDISLMTSAEVQDGRAIVSVKISDNGPGFAHDPESLDFPRSDRTPSGRGFGLFLSREIIQAHGGRLEITSERGLGTTIIVTLPAADDHGSR